MTTPTPTEQQKRIGPNDVRAPDMYEKEGRPQASPPRNAQRFAEALDAHVALIEERDILLRKVEGLQAMVDRLQMKLDMLDVDLSESKRACEMHKRRHMALESVLLSLSDTINSLMDRENIHRVEGVVANLERDLSTPPPNTGDE